MCVSSARTGLCGGAVSNGRPYRDPGDPERVTPWSPNSGSSRNSRSVHTLRRYPTAIVILPRAQRPHQFNIARAEHASDMGAQPFTNLDSKSAYAAGCPIDKHSLSWPHHPAVA